MNNVCKIALSIIQRYERVNNAEEFVIVIKDELQSIGQKQKQIETSEEKAYIKKQSRRSI